MKQIKIVFLLFLIAFICRLVLIKISFWTSPDALEYLNVAKNLANGQGFIKTVKIHHFDQNPIIRSAIGTKPPLYSLFIYPLYKILPSPYFIQFINLVLGAVSIIIFYFLSTQYLNSKWSFVAALLFALNPDYLINNRLILTEPLFLCLAFSAIYFSFNLKKNYLPTALFSALSYLTRTEGIIIILITTINYLYKKQYKYLIKLWLLFLFLLLPYFWYNFKINGSAFYSVGNFHFITLDFLNTTFNNYDQPVLPMFEFIKTNSTQIINKIFINSQILIKTIIRPSGLGWLVFLALMVKSIKKNYYLFLIAFLNFLIVSFTWGIVLDSPRYLALTYGLLIILAIYSLSKTNRKAQILILGSTFLFYLVFDSHRLYWARTQFDPNWQGEKINNVMNIILTKTNNQQVVAAPNPGLVNIKTNRPSVILPNNLNDKLIEKFINDYQPKAFLIGSQKSLTFSTLMKSKWEKITIEPYFLFIR